MPKDYSISLLRVLSMFVIVGYHCVCYYGIWDEFFPDAYSYEHIESFRFVCVLALQLFTFISGYLYARGCHRGLREVVRTKSMRLLVPYCFWSLVVASLFSFERSWSNFWGGMSHLWFLLMLFMCFMFVAITNVHHWRLRYVVIFVIALSALNWANSKYAIVTTNYLTFQYVTKYLPYFLAGSIVNKFEIPDKLQRMRPAYVGLLFIVVIMVLLLYHLRGGFPFSTVYMWVIVVLFFCCLYKWAGELVRITPPTLLASLDKSSMGIYLIHHVLIFIFLMYVPEAEDLMDSHPYTLPFILFVCVFSLSFALALLLNRFKYTSFLIGSIPKSK